MTLVRFIRLLARLFALRLLVGLLVIGAAPALAYADELVQNAKTLTNLSGIMLFNVIILSATAIGTTIVLINDHRQ